MKEKQTYRIDVVNPSEPLYFPLRYPVLYDRVDRETDAGADFCMGRGGRQGKREGGGGRRKTLKSVRVVLGATRRRGGRTDVSPCSAKRGRVNQLKETATKKKKEKGQGERKRTKSDPASA